MRWPTSSSEAAAHAMTNIIKRGSGSCDDQHHQARQRLMRWPTSSSAVWSRVLVHTASIPIYGLCRRGLDSTQRIWRTIGSCQTCHCCPRRQRRYWLHDLLIIWLHWLARAPPICLQGKPQSGDWLLLFMTEMKFCETQQENLHSPATRSVSHDVFISRLETDLGISGTGLVWFMSRLGDRLQRIIIGGVCSEPCAIRYGVPQGSVLGPLLFSVYNKPLGSTSRNHSRSRSLEYDFFVDFQLFMFVAHVQR